MAITLEQLRAHVHAREDAAKQARLLRADLLDRKIQDALKNIQESDLFQGFAKFQIPCEKSDHDFFQKNTLMNLFNERRATTHMRLSVLEVVINGAPGRDPDDYAFQCTVWFEPADAPETTSDFLLNRQ